MAYRETVRMTIAAGACALAAGIAAAGCSGDAIENMEKLALPPSGKLYHGVFPGSLRGDEDSLTSAMVSSYERTVGKKVAWVYFSHNWYKGREFPLQTAKWIRKRGAVPYIRLMTRSNPETLEGDADPAYALKDFLAGKFDADLRAWAQAAKEFATPLMVEWGTECNGSWFGWNGEHNGGNKTDGYGDPDKPDGVERFIDTYRHVVKLMRGEGAHNITWVFHVDDYDLPEEEWNHFEHYYPGDAYVDLIADSTYGALGPTEKVYDFASEIDKMYKRVATVTTKRPMIIAEFGSTAGTKEIKVEDWAKKALESLLSSRWPRLRGFSWWNERWSNDDNPAHDTDMRVQASKPLADTFRKVFTARASYIQQRPVTIKIDPVLGTAVP